MRQHKQPRKRSADSFRKVEPVAAAPNLITGHSNEGRQRDGWPAALICLALATVVFGAYFPVIRYDFINLDDPFYVTSNSFVSNGWHWKSVAWAFRDTHLGTWHPLTWFSHITDVQIYGLKASGHHLTNLLLHLVNTLGLFLLLRQMTGALWRSALVAALFGLHPLHVESVAWVSERKDVLSACFGWLTICAYVSKREVSNARYWVSEPGSPMTTSGPTPKPQLATLGWRSLCQYPLALFFFALGLMSKPMLVTWPVLLLLLDYWPLGRFPSPNASARLTIIGRLFWEKIPFFALSLADCLVTVWGQESAGAVKTLVEIPASSRIANAVVSYVGYLGKALWPVNLSVFYPFPSAWPARAVVGALALLSGLTTLAIVMARRRPYFLVGWFWYVITLTPVIGFIQVGIQGSADRYTYLPLVGIFIVVAWAAAELARTMWLRGVGIVLCLALVALTTLGTRRQVTHWESSETVFRHALSVTTNNALAHFCLAGALAERGHPDTAAAELRRAIQIQPDYRDARMRLGILRLEDGKPEAAAGEFAAVVKQNPEDTEAHLQYGNALARQGQTAQAIAHYEAAVSRQPDLVEAQNNLANALQRTGRIQESIAHYRAALRVEANLPEARNNLGAALAAQGQAAEAMQEYDAALRLRPDYAEAYHNRGNTFAALGDIGAAITNYRAALIYKPLYPKAENSLGRALVMAGSKGEAADHFLRALKMDSDAGNWEDVVKATLRALELARSRGQTNLVEAIEEQLRVHQPGGRRNEPGRN